jgi:hypothetical protein
MAKLIYLTIISLDGYVADEDGKFDWGEPDEEVHSFVNDLARPIGSYLYGRRMYEVLVAWETLQLADQPSFIRDFAEIWRAADKVVYSKTPPVGLQCQDAARARPQPRSSPAAEGVSRTRPRRRRSRARRPGLQGRPGRRVPPDPRADRGRRRNEGAPEGLRAELDLLDERRFGNGMAYLGYRT